MPAISKLVDRTRVETEPNSLDRRGSERRRTGVDLGGIEARPNRLLQGRSPITNEVVLSSSTAFQDMVLTLPYGSYSITPSAFVLRVA